MTSQYEERDRRSAETRQVLANIVTGLCIELGEGWTSKPFESGAWHITLLGPDGADLSLYEGYPHDGKVGVSANFSDRDADGHQFWYLPYKTPRPSINVNPSRGSKAVAADIKRRLLPTYLPLLAECNAARAKHFERMDETSDTAAILAIYIGGEFKKNQDGYTYSVNAYHSTKLRGASLDIKVSGSEVTFDRLRVSPFVAKELLKLLAQYHKNEES